MIEELLGVKGALGSLGVALLIFGLATGLLVVVAPKAEAAYSITRSNLELSQTNRAFVNIAAQARVSAINVEGSYMNYATMMSLFHGTSPSWRR